MSYLDNFSKKLNEILKLTCPEHIVIPIIGILTGAIIFSQTFPNLNLLILPIVSFSILVLAFNSSNGIFDQYIDKINKPKRPLPMETLDKKEAFSISIILYVVGLGFSLLVSEVIFILALVFVIFSLLYSLPPIRLKKEFLLGNLCLGIMYGLIPPLVGWIIFDGNLIFLTIFIYFLIIGTILASVKDFEDYIGDKTHKIKTIPVSFGLKKAAKIIPIFLIFVTTLFLLYWYLIGNIRFVIASIIVLIISVILLIFLTKTSQKILLMSRQDIIYETFHARLGIFLALFMEFIFALVYLIGV